MPLILTDRGYRNVMLPAIVNRDPGDETDKIEGPRCGCGRQIEAALVRLAAAKCFACRSSMRPEMIHGCA